MELRLKYTGRVSIKAKKSNGEVVELYSGHNGGTDSLFKLLARFLAGEASASDSLPTFMNIVSVVEGKQIALISTPMPVTKSYADNVNFGGGTTINNCAIMESMLYYSNILSTTLNTVSECKLLLVDGKETTLAEYPLTDTAVLKSVVPGMQLLITWTLYVSNE